MCYCSIHDIPSTTAVTDITTCMTHTTTVARYPTVIRIVNDATATDITTTIVKTLAISTAC